MKYYSNLEVEYKLRADGWSDEDLDALIFASPAPKAPAVYDIRSHVYFDFPSDRLLAHGSSFRVAKKKFTYCYKHTLEAGRAPIVRREVFSSLSYPICIDNPLHRRIPVLSVMFDTLPGVTAEESGQFRPLLEVTTQRKMRQVRDDTGEWLFSLCIDHVSAAAVGAGAVACQWRELEIECIGRNLYGLSAAKALFVYLRGAGLRPQRAGKYEIARIAMRTSVGCPTESGGY